MISAPLFGKMGRFGNQVFQFMFLKLYAEEYEQVLSLPTWAGRHLFSGAVDSEDVRYVELPPNLPPYREKWPDPSGALGRKHPPEGDDVCGHAWQGYAQYHTSYYLKNRDRINEIFAPLPDVAAPLDRAMLEIGEGGKRTVVGIHYRGGDQGTHIFPRTPPAWYLRWLEGNMSYLRNPVVLLSCEDRGISEYFSDWECVQAEDYVELGGRQKDYKYLRAERPSTMPANRLDFFPDFYLLSKCDVIVGPNSTFSFAAAMLGKKLREYWRACLPRHDFVKVDPWRAEPLNLDRVCDYPHLSGIRKGDVV